MILDVEFFEDNEAVDVEFGEGVEVVQDKHYTHTQSVASASWTITHNLNKYPSVTVVDSAGSVVVGDVQYLSLNDVVITFSGPFSGTAYLN